MVAAGNSGNNLSNSPEYPLPTILPIKLPSVLLPSINYQAGFSNFGPLVDLVAPGDTIIALTHQPTFKL